jgi:hypothetical protein
MRLFMTHDLSCTISDLITAARLCPRESPFQKAPRGRDLFVAAVAFTIQLAIDHGGADPEQMRALERDLIAKLSSTAPGNA